MADFADLLSEIGWTASDGTPLTSSMAAHAAWDTTAVLRRIGAMAATPDIDRRDGPTPDGITFVRAALTTWPDS